MIIRKIKNYLRDLFWNLLKVNWKLRSGIEIRISNDSDWFVFNEIFTNKEYEPALRLFLQPGLTAPLIIDLGANVGYFTLLVADELLLAGNTKFDILSIEASTSNFIALQKRVDQPLLNDKVKIYLGLAGKKNGSNSFVRSNQHYGHSVGYENFKERGGMEVNYINIEKLISDSNRRIDLLKCDIEGSEEVFINEYTDLLQRTVHAVFEFHANECNVDNCRLLLQQVGLNSKGVTKREIKYNTIVELFSRT